MTNPANQKVQAFRLIASAFLRQGQESILGESPSPYSTRSQLNCFCSINYFTGSHRAREEARVFSDTIWAKIDSSVAQHRDVLLNLAM